MTWKALDDQLQQWNGRLLAEIKVSPEAASRLATTIAAEVRFLDMRTKKELMGSSPVALTDRLQEVVAFQGWMKFASGISGNPYITRAQVICQNYFCFVYLSEACLKVLAKKSPPDSATRKCARFLTDNPVRAFRNAIAHANWRYRADFGAIEFWAKKGDKPDEPMTRFEVEQDDLDFWQALSRCIAYAAYSNL